MTKKKVLSKNKYHLLRKIGAILIIVSTIVGVFGLLLAKVKVGSVSCLSQIGTCNSETLFRIDNVKGHDIITTKKILASELLKDIFVEEYAIRYRIPNSYQVSLVEREPKYILKSSKNSWSAIVDKNGIVLSLGEKATEYPAILTDADLLNPGEKVDDTKFFALNIAYSLFTYYNVTKTGIIIADGVVFELADGMKVIFPLAGDREALLGSLALVLNRLNNADRNFTIDGKTSFSELDLRYKNPILR